MDLETDRKRSLAVQNMQLARENSLLKIKINELNSKVNELLRSNFKVESKLNMSKVHYKRILGEHIDRLERELLEKLESIIRTLDEVRERESLPRTARFKESNLRLRGEMLLAGERGEGEEEREEEGPCRKRRRGRSCSTRRQSMLMIPTGNDVCGSSTETDSNSSVEAPSNDNNTDQTVSCDSNPSTVPTVKTVPTDDIGNDTEGNVPHIVNTKPANNTSTPLGTVLPDEVGNKRGNRSGKDDCNDDYGNNNSNNNDSDKSTESSNDFTGSLIDFSIPEELEERKEQRGKIAPLTNKDSKNEEIGLDTANTTPTQTRPPPRSNIIPFSSKAPTHTSGTRCIKRVQNRKKQKVEIFKDSDANINDKVTITTESPSSQGSSAEAIHNSQPVTTNQPPRIRRKRKTVTTDEVLPTIKPERPRRTRGKVVDYTLPSLRVKMRRPSEKLVDATTFVDIHDLQVSSERNSTSHSLAVKSSRKSSPSPSLKPCVTPMASGTPVPMETESHRAVNGIKNIPDQNTQGKSQLEMKTGKNPEAKVKVKVRVKTETTPNPLSDITNVSKSRTDKKIRQRRKLFKNAIINDLSDENVGDYLPLCSSLSLSPDLCDSSSTNSGNNRSRTRSFGGNDDSSSSGLISQVSSFRLHEDDLAIFDTAVSHS